MSVRPAQAAGASTATWRLPLFALIAACAVASSSAACAHPRLAASPERPQAHAPLRVLYDLAVMALGTSPDEQTLERGATLPIADYVDSLLADPRFGRDVAPEVILNKRAVDLSEEAPWEVLRTTAPAATPPVLYLRAPCDAKLAESVHPWWDERGTVLVCPEAHQPTHLRDPKTGWYCGGDNLDVRRSSFCGCGPNLMNCARDEAQNAEMRRAFRDEVTRTIGWIVSADQPLAGVFTTNATVRTSYSELFYRRWRVVSGAASSVGDLSAWPAEGKLAPRDETVPGEHAGILTTPHLLLYGDTPRARMRNLYFDMWCAAPGSVNVTADQVLGLGVTDLRDGAGWQKLAAMPVCTECHARLDYGMQFFAGFPSSFVGVVFDPARVANGDGLLYGRDIRDPRGHAPSTPLGFARLAVAQDEWGRCMARDVADHVFGGGAGPEELQGVLQALRTKGTLRAMMREALLAYARRGAAAKGPVEAEGEVSPALPDGRIAPGPELASLLARECNGCHGSGPHDFLAGPTIARDDARAMLVAVAFKSMPKSRVMAPVARRRMVRALVATLLPDPRVRSLALAYFEDAAFTLPVHRGSALLRAIADRTGSREDEVASWALSDEGRHDTTGFTSSFAISFARAALVLCKAAGHTGAELDDCMMDAAGGDRAVKAGR
jgi:hypothetical protein